MSGNGAFQYFRDEGGVDYFCDEGGDGWKTVLDQRISHPMEVCQTQFQEYQRK